MTQEKKGVKEKVRIVWNNGVLLRYIFKFAPSMFFIRLLAILMILLSDLSFNILFLKYVIDSMSRGAQFETVLLYIGGLAIVRVLCDGVNSLYLQYVEPVARLKIHKGIYNLIYEKVETIDLEKFDDASFYNDYIWALNEVDNRTKNTFNVLIQLIQCILNVVMYSALALTYDKWVLIFVVVPVVANVLIGMKRAKLSYQFVSDLTPVNRKRDYSRRGFYLQQYAKEIKASEIGDVLRHNFNECVNQSISITKSYRSKLFAVTYGERHIGWLFAKVLSAVYMCYQVLIARAYTVGVFVVIYQAIGTFTTSLLSLFSIIPKFQENGLFAERLLKIINYESKIETGEGKVPMPKNLEEIRFQDVSFRYPHTDDMILKHVSFTIRKGEKIALVGINGAGKTTLIKLVMRLYDPTEGNIFLNGVDIRQYNVREYRKRFSTIFQDYQIFAVKLIENIFMRKTQTEDENQAEKCLEKGQLSGFSKDLQRNVTKEFDKEGLVFSGGQAQRLAIARAIARDGEMVIMDEASSALDPIAEAEINNTIMESMKEKSFIVISHRLSTIQNMDTIYFLKEGKIAESGSHKELLELNGGYAEMYNVQAEKYRER